MKVTAVKLRVSITRTGIREAGGGVERGHGQAAACASADSSVADIAAVTLPPHNCLVGSATSSDPREAARPRDLRVPSANLELSGRVFKRNISSPSTSKGQCMLLRFDGHGQIGPPSPTWNALSVPLRGSSESFSCRAHFSNYTSK
ncbi:unnamed protein product [Pleuronectes platessa]|uniref:Uncharacterized protein n=1 Tax=Pleuronectes platessa TaxID=8262 RepID=A0A9N7U268_PLEPL|nr:unnamed protein product [Pleuronectes platessa]